MITGVGSEKVTLHVFAETVISPHVGLGILLM
jgi:hypothetical protein